MDYRQTASHPVAHSSALSILPPAVRDPLVGPTQQSKYRRWCRTRAPSHLQSMRLYLDRRPSSSLQPVNPRASVHLQELETNEEYEEREDEFDVNEREDEQPVARCGEP